MVQTDSHQENRNHIRERFGPIFAEAMTRGAFAVVSPAPFASGEDPTLHFGALCDAARKSGAWQKLDQAAQHVDPTALTRSALLAACVAPSDVSGPLCPECLKENERFMAVLETPVAALSVVVGDSAPMVMCGSSEFVKRAMMQLSETFHLEPSMDEAV